MKLPYSSSSLPPALTTTLPSRQYPYFPHPLRFSHYYRFQLLPMWGFEFSAWPLRSRLKRLRGSLALFTRESVNVCNLNYPFSSRVCSLIHLSSNYTQLGLAFTLYSAEVLFNKGEPSSNSFLFNLFRKTSLRPLFNLSWPIARGYGRVSGRHEATGDRGT